MRGTTQKNENCIIFYIHHSTQSRFYPSKAKALADKIIFDELNGTVFDEEEAKNWSINISDKVRETVNGNAKDLF